MKKIFLLLSFLMAGNIYCQKNLEVSENKLTQRFYISLNDKLEKYDLEDLRTVKVSSVRIWKLNEVLTFKDSAAFTFYVSNGKEMISKTYSFKNSYAIDSLQDEIASQELLSNNEIRRKIDEFPITLEISTPEEYHVVSSYDNENLDRMISAIHEKYDLKSLSNDFIDQLPRGIYQAGMSMISVDRLLKNSEEQSDFYKKIVQEAERELQINANTPSVEFPLVLINEKPANFNTLNSLAVSEVKNYEILSETVTTTAIYGHRGENGVILVTTK